MKIIGVKLYLEIADAVRAGLGSENYLNKEKARGCRWATFIKDPNDQRRTLIEFESLAPAKKELVLKVWPNPYEEFTYEPIRRMVIKDLKAEAFYLTYTYQSGDLWKNLPTDKENNNDKVAEYTTAASWLNMLLAVDKKQIRERVSPNLTLADFYCKVCEIIAQDGINLPTTYKALNAKMNQYKAKSYGCLIHKCFGNQNRAKINDQESLDVLLSMIENPIQHDASTIAYFYNQWAAQNGREQISVETVKWRKKLHYFDVAEGREGKRAFDNKFIRKVKGARPSFPLCKVEHDDYNINMSFRKGDSHHERYISIMVIDAANEYVLGKSYIQGDNIPKGLGEFMIRCAYLDAMHTIKNLTGNWYLPFEVKSDKWMDKKLKDWYESFADKVATPVGSKNGRYIERFFGSKHLKLAEKLIGQESYNGNNITAKNRGYNTDLSDQSIREKTRAFVGIEAETKIENFFTLINKMPEIRNGKPDPSREQVWLDAWNKTQEEHKRPITEVQLFEIFGVKHNPQGRPVTITNAGVNVTIGNKEFSYELPESWMYERLRGEKVNVVYDPFDMTRVLITNSKNIRFVARSEEESSRSIQDMKIRDTKTYLAAVLSENKGMWSKSSSGRIERQQRVQVPLINAESILQSGLMTKEIKNQAEQAYLKSSSMDQQSDDDFETQMALLEKYSNS